MIRELPSRYPFDQHVVPEAVTLEVEDGYECYNQLFLPPDLEGGEQRPALIFNPDGSLVTFTATDGFFDRCLRGRRR